MRKARRCDVDVDDGDGDGGRCQHINGLLLHSTNAEGRFARRESSRAQAFDRTFGVMASYPFVINRPAADF